MCKCKCANVQMCNNFMDKNKVIYLISREVSLVAGDHSVNMSTLSFEQSNLSF